VSHGHFDGIKTHFLGFWADNLTMKLPTDQPTVKCFNVTALRDERWITNKNIWGTTQARLIRISGCYVRFLTTIFYYVSHFREDFPIFPWQKSSTLTWFWTIILIDIIKVKCYHLLLQKLKSCSLPRSAVIDVCNALPVMRRFASKVFVVSALQKLIYLL